VDLGGTNLLARSRKMYIGGGSVDLIVTKEMMSASICGWDYV